MTFTCPSRQARRAAARALRSIAAALVAFLLLTQSGCILVVLGLLSAPIAVGGVITGAAVGSRTAYMNLRDYYEALQGEDLTPEGQVTLRGLKLINDHRNAYRALDHTLEPYNLTPETYIVLGQLGRKEAQREEELSQSVGIRRFPLRESSKSLVDQKRVTKKTIEGATQFVFYATTDTGKQTLEEARRSLEHLRFEYLRRLSLDDRRELVRLIAKAVGEPDSPAVGTTGGILGLTTGGEAEYLLSKLFVLAHWELTRLLAQFALEDAEFQIISALWLREELGPRTLTSITQLRREEFGKVAQSLINQGYIEKVERVTEEGSYLLRLAPQAEKLRRQLQPQVDDFNARVFYRLSKAEQTDLANLLYKMSRGVVG